MNFNKKSLKDHESIFGSMFSTNCIFDEINEEYSKLGIGLKRWNKLRNRRFKISYKKMAEKYSEVSFALSQKYPKSLEKTQTEKALFRKIRASTRLEVKQSFWIGIFNFDFFITQVGEKGENSMKGLVIEADGSVHDKSFKMSKDQIRYEILHDLGIAVFCIPNEEINSTVPSLSISKLKTLRRLDSRARQRLMWNIHLFTLCCNLSEQKLLDFLEQPINQEPFQ